MYRQRGLSLIELMISIVLGLVLMTGVIQMFLSSRTVFSTQQGMSRIQENGRLAMEFLSKDIRMAGYLGCTSRLGSEASNTLKDSDKFPYRMNIGLEGYKAPLPTGADMTLNPLPIPGTDVLVVRSAVGEGAVVSSNNNASQVLAEAKQVAGACSGNTASYSGICTGDIVVVSDCTKARIFQATGITAAGTPPASGIVNIAIDHASDGTPGNALASWSASGSVDMIFQPGADVLPMKHTVYYVGRGTSGEPALFQSINGTSPSLELLEGVEDMRLFYSRESTPTVYNTIADLPTGIWSTATNPVVSVRVELLLRSTEDGVLDEPQFFEFPLGTTPRKAVPDDRRMRQVFTSTVGIRSRLP